MILSFRTDRPGQTVQTQIRLLLEEQSDQGLHCLPFHLHHLDPHSSNFRLITTNILGVRIFRKFTTNNGSLRLISLYFCSHNFESFPRVPLVDPEPKTWERICDVQRKSDLCS